MAWLILASLAWGSPASIAPVSVEHAPFHRLVFANHDLAVLDNIYPPHSDSGFHRHPRELFYVVIAPARASTQRAGQALRPLPPLAPGSVGMNPMTAEPFVHRVVNSDRKPFHIVAVELRGDGPIGRPVSERSAASGFTVVHDNPRVRAWRLILQPGRSAPPLRLAGTGVRIFVRGGTLSAASAHHPDQQLAVAAGDFEQLRPGSTVSLKNIGRTPIELVDVELK